jgi:hypothetical protein
VALERVSRPGRGQVKSRLESRLEVRGPLQPLELRRGIAVIALLQVCIN